jgi:hypothetical protein
MGKNKKNLAMLLVIDCLEVGPVQLDKNRLIAPYILTKGNAKDQIQLMYRYEEPVFEVNNPASLNLASMIAVQVAINYGLFCKKIIFHGIFDKNDRKFIKNMMENTAREIYVKKFLEPNTFLTAEYKNIPILKLDSYLQAELIFRNKPGDTVLPDIEWETDRNAYAVSSSGGKDSLLTYGLLRELGNKTYPVFINESGKHWYTALNAYRDFKKNVTDTIRVWTNSDRVFSWMLRHFPFIRKNFAGIRSDEYPIRLWTVAVFLFAALPCLRKRKTGRLIIGDEFDTTIKKYYHKIPHYNGLFDQSRFFDYQLSLYYYKKKWNIEQFSILRFLSELLILKILAERYPALQSNQISCHATHIKNGRVYPCGKCEKCRRIVCMLIALNKNPKNCGYNDEQIKYCLQSIGTKGVHQEAEGAEHMRYLLKKKNVVSGNTSFTGKANPEVMKIRVDSKYSPMKDVPRELRIPLFTLLLKYAEGSVEKNNGIWKDINILNKEYISVPYALENLI